MFVCVFACDVCFCVISMFTCLFIIKCCGSRRETCTQFPCLKPHISHFTRTPHGQLLTSLYVLKCFFWLQYYLHSQIRYSCKIMAAAESCHRVLVSYFCVAMTVLVMFCPEFTAGFESMQHLCKTVSFVTSNTQTVTTVHVT